MTLDDLKTRLAEQDAKLDRVVRLHATEVRKLQLSKATSTLRWMVPGLVLELLMAIAAVVWLGDFIAGHLQEPRFLIPAVLVDCGAVALMGSCIWQLVAISNLNYALPVVTVQKELGKLRVLRIRTTKWTMILSFVLWFPVLIVLLEGLLGVDLWLILGAVSTKDGSFFAWAVGNVLFGMAAALALMWIWNRYAEREGRSSTIKRIMDDFAGRSLTDALATLDEVVRFEAEPYEANGSTE